MDRLELVEYDRIFFEKSREWLSDEVMNYMTDTGELPKESERIRWFESIPSREDYLIWGVMIGDTPIGACGLKNIKGNRAEYWGYIGEKNYWGKGWGNQMMLLLESKAAAKNLNVLYLKVLKDNERAISLYVKRGFVKDNDDSHYCYMHKEL